MADLLSIARPYARAAFDYGLEKKELAAWKGFIEACAEISENPEMKKLLAHYQINANELLKVFLAVLPKSLTREHQQFLTLMAENKRLTLFEEVKNLFNLYYAAHERVQSVRLVTATPADEALQEKFKKALMKRLNCQVTLTLETDPALLGGAFIQIGDSVIDGSVRGQLTRLLEFSLR